MIRIFAALGLALCLAAPAQALEPERTGQDTFITRSVFAQGRLWLLTDAGKLFTITEGAPTRTTIGLPEPARDLWIANGRANVVTCPRSNCRTWTVRHFDGGWRTDSTIDAHHNERIVGVSAASGETVFVTSLRLITVKGSDVQSTPFPDAIAPPDGEFSIARITSVLVEPDRVLLGINAGEWGGGLSAINRKTGALSRIEARGKDLCEGPLNGACDPVNALVEDPFKPGCVIAAIGLVHFGPNGRLVEVCGTSVTRLYYRNLRDCDETAPEPTGPGVPRCIKHNGEMGFMEEAFFGLARNADIVWAVGATGLYRISKDGVAYQQDKPKVSDVDGISVSYDLPGFVIVFTEVNRRASVSGAAPMLISRH